MYIRKDKGPRIVDLPNGAKLTRADLPPADTVRWVASRKARVVLAVQSGLITRKEAGTRYGLSEEELESWVNRATHHGQKALRATSQHLYRRE